MTNTSCYFEPNTTYAVLTSFGVLLAVLALASNFVLLAAMHKIKLFTGNIGKLLKNNSVALILFSLASVVLNGYDIYTTVVKDHFLKVYQCAELDILRTYAKHILLVNFVMIALERCMACYTATKITTEAPNSKFWVPGCWVIGAAATASLSLEALLSKEYVTCHYCELVTIISPNALYLDKALFLVGEAFACMSFVFILKKARALFNQFSMRTSEYSIDGRYNIRQNIKACEMLLPSVGAHAVFWGIESSIELAFKVHLEATESELHHHDVYVLQLSADLLLLYAILHPLLIYKTNASVKQVLNRWFKRGQVDIDIQIEAEKQNRAHFHRQIERCWNEAAPKEF